MSAIHISLSYTTYGQNEIREIIAECKQYCFQNSTHLSSDTDSQNIRLLRFTHPLFCLYTHASR